MADIKWCVICHNRYTPVHLFFHLIQHVKQNNFVCLLCAQRIRFNTCVDLNNHNINHHRISNPFRCEFCSDRCLNVLQLFFHMLEAHQNLAFTEEAEEFLRPCDVPTNNDESEDEEIEIYSDHESENEELENNSDHESEYEETEENVASAIAKKQHTEEIGAGEFLVPFEDLPNNDVILDESEENLASGDTEPSGIQRISDVKLSSPSRIPGKQELAKKQHAKGNMFRSKTQSAVAKQDKIKKQHVAKKLHESKNQPAATKDIPLKRHDVAKLDGQRKRPASAKLSEPKRVCGEDKQDRCNRRSAAIKSQHDNSEIKFNIGTTGIKFKIRPTKESLVKKLDVDTSESNHVLSKSEKSISVAKYNVIKRCRPSVDKLKKSLNVARKKKGSIATKPKVIPTVRKSKKIPAVFKPKPITERIKRLRMEREIATIAFLKEENRKRKDGTYSYYDNPRDKKTCHQSSPEREIVRLEKELAVKHSA